jgi:hypothetical protein
MRGNMISRRNLFDYFTGDAGAVDDYYENLRQRHLNVTAPRIRVRNAVIEREGSR